MFSINNLLRTMIFSGIILILVSSCSKDEDTLFKDCILPWKEFELIPQAELPKEIVDFTYKTYPTADTIIGGVLSFCKNEKRLLIQAEGTDDGNLLVYDSCGKLIAKGQIELGTEIRNLIRESVKKELSNVASLYDTIIIIYENGTIEYTAEVFFDGNSSIYLIDKDGDIICKLF